MTFAFGRGRAYDLADAEHRLRARRAAGQHDGFGVGRDLNLFAGKQLVQLLLEAADRLLDDQVVLRALAAAPDDQADRPRASFRR